MLSPALFSLLLAMAPRPQTPTEPKATPPPQAPLPGEDVFAGSSRAELIDSGRVYFRSCGLCHGKDGRGARCPTLVNSDFVQGDKARLLRYVLRANDTVRVNGTLWRGREMPPLEDLADFEVAALMTYIRSLNDSLVTCTPEDPQAGTWAECARKPRPVADIAADSVTTADVAAARVLLPPRKP
jgi:mono/diheme cytochrome c family protein